MPQLEVRTLHAHRGCGFKAIGNVVIARWLLFAAFENARKESPHPTSVTLIANRHPFTLAGNAVESVAGSGRGSESRKIVVAFAIVVVLVGCVFIGCIGSAGSTNAESIQLSSEVF